MQVVVVAGEAGVGKTSQIPLFLLEEHEEAGRGTEAVVVVAQHEEGLTARAAARAAWERG